MYFVGKGRLAYFVDELHVHIVYERIEDKDYFGEVEFFFADQRENNVKSATICELLALSREDLFNKIFPEFPNLKLEMIIEAAATRERLKRLREEVWSRRREQYRRAKGMSITLSHNEIGRLVELQPSLRTELVFEQEAEVEKGRSPVYLTVPNSPKPYETSPKSALSASGLEISSSPKSTLFPTPISKNPSEFPPPEPLSKSLKCSQFTLELPAQPDTRRRSRRSITSPSPGLPPAPLDPVKSRIAELKTIMNSHTLALVQENKADATEEMMHSYKRIVARMTRVEVIVWRLMAGKRRASLTIEPQISTLQ